MRYTALACDYDGTIAHHGLVDTPTRAALERVRASGRKLLLVTGRELDDLQRVFPDLPLFDRIVAENGAVLYDPAIREIRTLAAPPPAEFARTLERRGVAPLSAGHVIVATWEPHDRTVFDVVRTMQLELQVIFNKGAVMVLPSGVNKATGLRAALQDLGLSTHNAVGVGDAENDHAFLAECECSVAVANALDSVKARVDLVTRGDHGTGVVELIDRLVENDLADLAPRLTRRDILLGRAETGDEVRLPSYGGGILVAGPSGAGKTTVTTALIERLAEARYQFCIIDPEGDYHGLESAVALRGDARTLTDEAMQLLERRFENAIVTLMDVRLSDRPAFLQALLPHLLELRTRVGRPHWLVVDEAHHLLPAGWAPSAAMLPGALVNLMLVTVHADHVARPALQLVDSLIAVGRDAQATVDAFARGRGIAPPSLPSPGTADAVWFWRAAVGNPPVRVRVEPPTSERRRHRRKYAEGELGADKSFFFRGARGHLNLRAQNLTMFAQIAEGVDDETWLHHLRRHDYSAWFREAIKDEELAEEAEEVERREELSSSESRARIRAAIERRYTAPA
jgi:hydroxymethylpyrimidine pyrophosphatase-like HAD family hydrolase